RSAAHRASTTLSPSTSLSTARPHTTAHVYTPTPARGRSRPYPSTTTFKPVKNPPPHSCGGGAERAVGEGAGAAEPEGKAGSASAEVRLIPLQDREVLERETGAAHDRRLG